MTTEQILSQLIETFAYYADKCERLAIEAKKDGNPLASKFFLGEANGYAGAKINVEQMLDQIIDEEEYQRLLNEPQNKTPR